MWKFSFSSIWTPWLYSSKNQQVNTCWPEKFLHHILQILKIILNTLNDPISLIFLEIQSTLSRLLPKIPVLFQFFTCTPNSFCVWRGAPQFIRYFTHTFSHLFAKIVHFPGPWTRIRYPIFHKAKCELQWVFSRNHVILASVHENWEL